MFNGLLIKKRYNTYVKILLYTILILVCFWNIVNGFDLSDTGYNLNSYVFAIDNYESINFSIIGTSIFGNLILGMFNLFSIPSYIGFKIITCIITLTLVILIIFLLKKYIPINLLLISEILAVFLAKGHIQTLMYSNLSAFVLTISALLLIIGLIEQKNSLIFMTGILLGFNFFVRISNIIQLLLIVSIFYYNKISKCKALLYFCLGWICSIMVMLFIIYMLYGLQDLKEMFSVYLSESINSEDAHSVLDSLKINLIQGLIGMFWLGILYFVFFIIDKLLRKMSDGLYYKVSLSITIGILITFLMIKYTPLYTITFINKLYLYFYSLHLSFSIVVALFCLQVLNYCFIKRNKNEKVALILFVGFLITITLPIGSNQGLSLLYMSFFIQLPILIYVLQQKIKSVHVFVLSYFIAMMVMRNSTYLFRDDYDSVSNYFTSIPKLQFVKSSKDRVDAIEQLYSYFESTNYEGSKLITYGSIPLLSYLLDMPPFFNDYNGWIEMSQCTVDEMKEQLKNREENPFIIISKIEVNNSIWPNDSTKKDMELIKKNDPKYDLIMTFIKENNYELKYNDDNFLIYANKS